MAQLSPSKGRTRADYHNGPVNGFGDLQARVCLVGLAPGAHGANRTGRPFTGDGAGDFMYPLLHLAGFSNQSEVLSADDGLELNDLYITNAVKCLPPENKPNAAEFAACRPYLEKELQELKALRVIIALGHGAHKSLLRLFQSQGLIKRLGEVPFGHGSTHQLANGLTLIGCYHTSRYNVQTGRMNNRMFLDLLDQVSLLLE
ncbi:MAG: uracil-DNA glycosylase [Desulfuromonadales bacterium]|nr:uracil-DNA glycosylase [Desulfuromonadales bacterium]